MIIGYKGFDENLKCRNFQYNIGKTYKKKEKPIICKRGFHYCKELKDVFEYYQYNFRNRFCEVEILGDIDLYIECSYSKQCTNKIRIIRELSEEDICNILDIDYNTYIKYKHIYYNDLDRFNMIFIGLIEGIDVSVYANTKFNLNQMHQIYFGLKNNLDTSKYADPKFDEYQMDQIRYGLKDDLDVFKYDDPKFNNDQMRQIRYGLEDNIDISKYADPKYTAEQMAQIRVGLKDNLDASKYTIPIFEEYQKEQIRIRLENFRSKELDIY